MTGDAVKAVLLTGRTIHNDACRACAGGMARALRRLIAVSAFAAAFVSWPAVAATEILAVIAQKSPAHEEALAALRASLTDIPGSGRTLHVMTAAEFSDSGARATHRKLPGLVVTLGTAAAAAVLAQRLPIPTYCTFLPQATYTELVNRAGGTRAHLSALYLDQPLARQLRLIRLALPGRTRVGVVLGPDSRKTERELHRAAAAAGIVPRMEQISDEKQLVGALHRVLDDTDVLLAVPDALVFNRHTVQNVLLTTYRLGKPVAGFSRAYVTAGALFAVYSTPSQIGRQIGEELLAMQNKAGRPVPPTGYPRYFSVEVNERVAHSLGIEPLRADDLARQLSGNGAGDNP